MEATQNWSRDLSCHVCISLDNYDYRNFWITHWTIKTVDVRFLPLTTGSYYLYHLLACECFLLMVTLFKLIRAWIQCIWNHRKTQRMHKLGGKKGERGEFYKGGGEKGTPKGRERMVNYAKICNPLAIVSFTYSYVQWCGTSIDIDMISLTQMLW